jgi:hypothetical protein
VRLRSKRKVRKTLRLGTMALVSWRSTSPK